MELILLFFLGVPIFVLLSPISQAKFGILAGLGATIVLYVLWIRQPLITSNDPAGNAMAMGYQAFAYISAIGGGVATALYHMTRLIWPAQKHAGMNTSRYVIFLVLSVPMGGLCMLIIDVIRFAI